MMQEAARPQDGPDCAAAGAPSPHDEAARFLTAGDAESTDARLPNAQPQTLVQMITSIGRGVNEDIFLLSPDYRILWANQAAISHSACKPDEVVGNFCYRATHGNDAPCEGPLDPCPLRVTKESGRPATFFHTHFGQGGGSLSVEVTAYPLKNREGQPTSYVLIARDITEHARVQARMQESDEKLRAIFESVADGLVVTDLKANIVDINVTALRQQGFADKSGILGGNAFEFIAEKDRMKALETLQTTLTEGASGVVELSLVAKDKREFPAEVSGTLLRDAEGNPAGFVAVIRDITERCLAEHRNKELRDYLELQIARMPTGLITWGPDFHVRSWNPAAEKIFGFTSREALNRHPYDFIVPKEAQPDVDVTWRTLLEGEDTHSVNDNITKDDRAIACDWLNTPLKDKNGEVAGVLSMVQDITERKRMQEAIKESREFLAGPFDSIPDVVTVQDPDYHIIMANKVAKEVFGPDIVGKKCFEALSDRPDVCQDCPIAAVLATGRPHFLRKVGEQTGKTWEIMAPPLKDGLGNVIAVFEHGRDITEHRRMEEAIEKSREFLAGLFDSLADVVSVHSPDFTIMMANRVAKNIFGHDIEGKKCHEVFAGRSDVCLDCPTARVLATGRPSYAVKKDDKTGMTYEVMGSPLKDSNGNVTAVFEHGRDITERLRMQEKAREADILMEVDRLRTELLANVSHELRTPLASIQGYASTMLQYDVHWTDQDRKEFLGIIEQESVRLTRLISDLLDMSRIDARALTLGRKYCRVDDIFGSVNNRLAALAQAHNLQVSIAPGLPAVFVDDARIGQVLTNLVENSAKYSRQGTLISITAEASGGRVVVSVADEGEGIPAALLDKIFDRFYQADNIAKGKKQGTGLGLSICRGILEAHGEKIWAESKPGIGSTFSFSLPLADDDRDGFSD